MLHENDSASSQRNELYNQPLIISPHAFGQFQTRSGLSIVAAAEQLRDRLSQATPITKHPTLILNPRMRADNSDARFFQDAGDEHIVYVIKRGDRTKKERKRGTLVLKTTLYG